MDLVETDAGTEVTGDYCKVGEEGRRRGEEGRRGGEEERKGGEEGRRGILSEYQFPSSY